MYAWLRANLLVALRCWVDWIDPPVEPSPPPPPAPDPIKDLTKTLILKQEKKDTSGENKRHQVYASLIKAFPSESKRKLSFTIEQVLQEMK